MYATTNFCDFDFTKKLKCSTNLGTMRIRITELWKKSAILGLLQQSHYLLKYLLTYIIRMRERESICVFGSEIYYIIFKKKWSIKGKKGAIIFFS